MLRKRLAVLTLIVAGGLAGRWVWPEASALAQVSIAQNAAEISGKTVMLSDGATAHTVTNLFTFSRSGATPFSVAAGSAAVPNLLNWTPITITTTGTQNNFAPGLVGNTVIRCNNASLLTITGLGGGIDGQMVLFLGLNAEVDFVNASGLSTATNQFTNLISGNTPIIAGAVGFGRALYTYSSAAGRWLLINHEQGSYIDFASSSTVTGWVSFATDAKHVWYRVDGREVRVIFYIEGTSNATSASFTLPYTAAAFGVPTTGGNLGPFTFNTTAVDNSSALTVATHGWLQSSTATAQLFPSNAGGNWTNTATKAVGGQFYYSTSN